MAKAQHPAEVGDRVEVIAIGLANGQQGKIIHINGDGQLIIGLDNNPSAFSCYPDDVILMVD